MMNYELKRVIVKNLGLSPTAEQDEAIDVFCQFIMSRPNPRMARLTPCTSAMILRGSAGTGKTTLAAAIVKGLLELKQKLVLMAPTGRAAKVFSLYAEQPAYTIHRRIYRQRNAGDMSMFTLSDNLHTDTLFIVDEASMISSEPQWADGNGEVLFGSGSLLDDLVHYVYSGRNCRMMLIGDQAQLPPVGADPTVCPPALQSDVLRGYGLQVFEAALTEVLRQSQQSGILYNATRIRQTEDNELGMVSLPEILISGFSDIKDVPGDELIEQLTSSYSEVGMDETIVVTRSNKRANVYNQGIRRTILDREDELCRGDQLMVVKNNYYWGQRQGLPATSDRQGANASGEQTEAKHLEYIANGDRCVVQRVRNVHEMHGFRFAEVTLLFPDYDDYELTATVMLDTLTSEAPALTREQQGQLFQRVMEDYQDVPYKSERLKKLKEDRYYNALQVKFGYAVTCHKAQGGQWEHVYVDQGYMTDDMLTPEYVHWLYTAFTRATKKLFLVNWPKKQVALAPQ
jgi:tRNA A37 threonylcarbamoyladenosine biosynthesis protein TsaE